ncbi:MAG: hypothetical protein IKJ16_04955 [Agathobacter sp.]|nr:hypothetical protein [Agathobacter sp.]
MAKLLEIKDQIFRLRGEYETYFKFIYKFVIALALFCIVDVSVGFNESISTFPIALLLALVCCLLPQSVTLFVAAALIVANLYVLSLEVALTSVLVFVLIFFLYFRFSPKDGVLFALTPICFALHIPYILPIGTGLLRKAHSAAAVACGTVCYFFLDGIYQNVTALQATIAGGGDVVATKMTITAGQLLTNKEMYFTVIVFVISTIVVFGIRNMVIDHAWKVAMASGALVQISGLFVGYLLFDISGKTLGMILGNLVAVALGLALEFLFMDLDYSRTERVQFEDDDYYYYVKAVPKKMIASMDKEVIEFSGKNPLDKIKSRRKKEEDAVSRKQIAQELEIDEDLL